MRSGTAESDMRVGVAQDVEGERVVEYFFVKVGRPVEHHHPLAPLDPHPAEVGVDQGGPLERRDRGGPPNDLVGRGLRSLRLEQLPLVRVVGEGHHALGDRVAGRLVAGDAQRDDEHAELGLGEMLALGVGLHQRRDDVIRGLVGPARRQLHGVPHQFARRRQCVVVGELRVVAADHFVGPVEKLVLVLRWHPEQAGDGLQRQLAGHL